MPGSTLCRASARAASNAQRSDHTDPESSRSRSSTQVRNRGRLLRCGEASSNLEEALAEAVPRFGRIGFASGQRDVRGFSLVSPPGMGSEEREQLQSLLAPSALDRLTAKQNPEPAQAQDAPRGLLLRDWASP